MYKCIFIITDKDDINFFILIKNPGSLNPAVILSLEILIT